VTSQDAESVVRYEGVEGWLSVPLSVFGEGPDASHFVIRCAACRWVGQGYGLMPSALEQLREHRQEEHTDGR
jgi:hypothetical protein